MQPPSGMGLEQMLAEALRHHRAGQLADAERLYRAILSIDSRHAESLHLLGVIAHQTGRNDVAAGLIATAIDIDGTVARYHVHLGVALKGLRRFDAAMAAYHAAIRIEPPFAEAHYNLGNALKDQQRLDEAAASYERALALKPDFAAALINLGLTLLACGKEERSLDCALQVLKIEENDKAKELFVRSLGSLQSPPAVRHGGQVRSFLLRALSEPWARPSQLVPACIGVIKRDPVILAAIECAQNSPGEPAGDEFSAGGPLGVTLSDPLPIALLKAAPVTDTGFESLLCRARRALLAFAQSARGGTPDMPGLLAFYVALAQQCFINEYVFALADDELAHARDLWEALAAALDSDVAFLRSGLSR